MNAEVDNGMGMESPFDGTKFSWAGIGRKNSCYGTLKFELKENFMKFCLR